MSFMNIIVWKKKKNQEMNIKLRNYKEKERSIRRMVLRNNKSLHRLLKVSKVTSSHDNSQKYSAVLHFLHKYGAYRRVRSSKVNFPLNERLGIGAKQKTGTSMQPYIFTLRDVRSRCACGPTTYLLISGNIRKR